MKKGMIALVLLMLAGAGFGAWYVMRTGGSGKEVALASVFPADTLVFVQVRDAAGQMAALGRSPLAEAFADFRMDAFLSELGAPPDMAEKALFFREKIFSESNFMLFNALFGKDAAVGVLPETFGGGGEGGLAGLVLVSRPERDASLVSFLSQWIPHIESRDLPARQGIEGRVLILENGREIFTAVSEGLLMAAFSRKSLDRLLDVAGGGAVSLENHAPFVTMEKKLGEGVPRSFFFYGDVAAMLPRMETHLARLVREAGEPPLEGPALGMLKGIGQLAYGRLEGKDALRRTEGRATLDRNLMDAGTRARVDRPARKPAPLWMAPQETVLFLWDGSFDLRDAVASQFSDPEALAAFQQGFEVWTGMPFEALCDILGQEVALVFTGLNAAEGMFPVPRLAFVLESSAPETLAALLERVTDQAGEMTGTAFARSSETVEEIAVHHVDLPLAESFRPAWATVGRYFVVGAHPDVLAAMIYARSTGRNLVTDTHFRTVDRGLTQDNQSVSYARVDSLMDVFLDLAYWGLFMNRMSDPEGAESTEVVIEKLLRPLLTGLKMYTAVGSRSFVEGDALVLRSYTHVP